MSYKRKTKIEFTPAQELRLRRLAKRRDDEMWRRFCGYVTDALMNHTRSKLTVSVWDGHIDSISRSHTQTNAVKSERIGKTK